MNKNRQKIGGELLHYQQNQALEQPGQLVWVKHTVTELEGGMDSVYAPHQ